MATAATAGMAIGAPWRGRAVDRLGLRRALVPSIVAEAVVWGSAPFVGYGLPLVVAFAGGVLGLPIFTVARQSLAALVPAEQRRTAYSLDSMGVELSFMAGPALGVVVATQLSTQIALLGVGTCMVLAGLALIAFDPRTRSEAAAADAADLVGARRADPPGGCVVRARGHRDVRRGRPAVPERVRGEAMGWDGSALTLGNAMGAPPAGAAIDAAAPWAGFVTVGRVGLVLAGAGLAVQGLLARKSGAPEIMGDTVPAAAAESVSAG